ncbi:FtsX-like permease family protein [Rhodobacteraceae bacterium 2376]|uniref:FtsX-like permease family protein n=1 Tax=Rhabdonatronobacter sediminivivens TaxID=2743469 RepID=A0A7Z0HZE7_9RHOB|nr:FtsX-like permease family protein [Rhabdonatronobacter sediminivivens]NYS25119.1 FtsX-like permease family protein [Rhabdonatronobacter sediminivivens]
MKVLDRKLLRDLRRIWAQTLAIALVLGCGIMLLVAAQATQRTLMATKTAYYDRHLFADVFAPVSRAPGAVAGELAAIDGVAQAEGRIGFYAVLDVEDMAEPAMGRVVSLPRDVAGMLNRPLLRRGRMPDPDNPDEVLINEPFGRSNGLEPGSRFHGILGGQLRELVVAGWALSPEFIYTVGPGALMPDDRRFGIVWMNETAAASAQNMSGAVNEITLRLSRGADARAVRSAVDQFTARYGGTGAYGRDRHPSHAFLDGELQQLGALATYMPPIFLLVAAFLVNMVLTRLIALERTQIGLMKAVGYTTGEIATHYLKLAGLIGVAGVVLGSIVGWWLTDGMLFIYQEFFGFPFLVRDTGTGPMALAAVLGLATALLGGARAVWSSVRLNPAEAMSPPAPPRFSRGRADRFISWLALRQTSMMILRSIIRWPGRAAITLFGVSASVGVLVASYFLFDALEVMTDSVFTQSNRQHLTLTLGDSAPEIAVTDALTLPGVMQAEGGYAVPVRLIHGHRDRLSALQGHYPGATLHRLVDDDSRPVELPPQGLVLPEMLARTLEARPGDMIAVELMSPPREVLDLPLVAVIQQGLGQEAHIAAPALFEAMRMAPRVTHIHLLADPAQMDALYAEVKRTPALAGLSDWAEVRRQFDDNVSENLLMMVTIYTIIGVLIAIGVVYNAARIQLSERSYELASLRVLGFSRREVGYVLVGEMMLLTVLAIPLGWVLGTWFAEGMTEALSTDMVYIPFAISRRTYALAAIAVFLAALVSVLLVRRRLDRVDLALALKARE